jgi:hypothetical protein
MYIIEMNFEELNICWFSIYIVYSNFFGCQNANIYVFNYGIQIPGST